MSAIIAPRRFEQHYCDECMTTHWVEIIGHREICQGESYTPKDTPTHYTKWSAGGIELLEKANRQQLPIEWIVLAETERETIDQNQDW